MEYSVDLHTHSIASGHAYSTVKEMIESAEEKGITMLGITEHAKKMPGACNEMYFHNFRAVNKKIGNVEVLLGVELNILDKDGNVDMRNEMLKSMAVTIASIHLPCYSGKSIEEHTNAVIKCCENPLINIIGHPDDGRYPLDYKAVVEAAKNSGTLLEVNDNSLSSRGFRLNAKENYKIMLKHCMEMQVPVIIDSDAHFYTRVGDHCNALKLMEEIGFPLDLVLNYYPEKLKEYLNAYKNL